MNYIYTHMRICTHPYTYTHGLGWGWVWMQAWGPWMSVRVGAIGTQKQYTHTYYIFWIQKRIHIIHTPYIYRYTCTHTHNMHWIQHTDMQSHHLQNIRNHEQTKERTKHRITFTWKWSNEVTKANNRNSIQVTIPNKG